MTTDQPNPRYAEQSGVPYTEPAVEDGDGPRPALTTDPGPMTTTRPGPAQPTVTATDETHCHRCGGPNIVWSAPSPLWNEVMRGGSINGNEIHDGIVCPICFAVLAKERGIADLWKFFAGRVNVPLETVTPSGRVWDEQTWKWIDPADAVNLGNHRRLTQPAPNGCDFCSVEPGEKHRYPNCPGNREASDA